MTSQRYGSLCLTVPFRMPELTVAVEIKDPKTLAHGAVNVLAGMPGSDLDELARQFAAIVSVAIDRGASLEEIRRALPAISTNASAFVQLAPALLSAGIDVLAQARTSLTGTGLLDEHDGE